ncbi:hypothetical protein DL95DRAFT_125439 [Leptodontidium sp. 2 PMI_412]|nr:hypothetical protein DL95DRAFT_125439 [Leptodontidium sp. 2 PMI_412]
MRPLPLQSVTPALATSTPASTHIHIPLRSTDYSPYPPPRSPACLPASSQPIYSYTLSHSSCLSLSLLLPYLTSLRNSLPHSFHHCLARVLSTNSLDPSSLPAH